MPLPVRLLVTLAVVTALAAIQYVPLAGLDGDVLDQTGIEPKLVSVALLGPMTWITCFLYVEFGALVRSRWRALRNGGPEARARLDRAARIVWVFVAAMQGFAIAVNLEQINDGRTALVVDPGSPFRVLTVLTLMAGSALYWLGARTISAWGFGNGFALITGLALAETLVPGLQSLELFGDTGRASLPPVLLMVIAVIAATWRLPRLWSRDGTIPLLSAGLVPVAAAVTLPGMLPRFGMEPLSESALATVTVALALGGTLLYAALFHFPGNVAAVTGTSVEAAEAAFRSTLPVAATVVVAVAVASSGALPGLPIVDLVALAAVSAHAFDLHAEWRARAELGDVAVAWPLHRVYALPPMLHALERAGIPTAVRGLRFRQMFHFFGPYVPIEILVPRHRLAEAQGVLGGVPEQQASP